MKSINRLFQPGSKYKTLALIFLMPVVTLGAFLTARAERLQPETASDALVVNLIPASDASCMANVIVPRQTQNLIPNPGFEEAIPSDVWLSEGKCTFSRDPTAHSEGRYSARIAGVGSNNECLWYTAIEAIPIESGRYYDFSCKVNSNLDSGEAYAQISFFNEKKQHIRGSICATDSVINTGGQWLDVAGSERAPSDAHYAQVEVGISGSSTGLARFDDCFLGLAVDLDIEKESHPDPVEQGQSLAYTITYRNTGRESATDVQVIDNFPDEVVFQSANPPPEPGLNNFWDIGILLPGASGRIDVAVQVRDQTTSCNLINYSGIRSDETVLAVSDVETTTITDCNASQCEVRITPASGAQNDIIPGTTVSYSNFFITNSGSQAGTVTVEADSSQNWEVMIEPPSPYILTPGTSRPTTVSIRVPEDPTEAMSDTADVTTMTATLECDAGASSSDTATMATTIGRQIGVEIEPDYSKPPGSSVTFTHTLTNTGNWTDTIDLTLQTDPGDLSVAVEPSPPFMLGPGMAIPITLDAYQMPCGAVITVTAISQFANNMFDKVIDHAFPCVGSLLFLPVVNKSYCEDSDEVRNGDFENGLQGWKTEGVLPISVACKPENPLEGCAARIGDPNFPPEAPDSVPMGRGTIYQTVRVPNVSSPSLTFDYKFCSYDDKEYDTLEVAVTDINVPVWKIGNTTGTYPKCYDTINKPRQVIDLSDYRDECVTVYFSVWNRDLPQYNSWAYIDNIRLNP
jgi:uncharacterized repeat protein (TIGR01451 family)